MVRCCISLLVETKLSSLCQTIIWNGCDMCLFMLHLGATKMLMIQTRWQKNLHISFLTKRSLLDSRYRSSVKKMSTSTASLLWCDGRYSDKFKYMSVLHLFNLSLWIFSTRYTQRSEPSPRVPLFCSYHILTWFVIYYWTDAQHHGIY